LSIEGLKVLEEEAVQLEEGRYKFLSHLAVQSSVTFVELHLALAKNTIAHFGEEFKKRKKQRIKRQNRSKDIQKRYDTQVRNNLVQQSYARGIFIAFEFFYFCSCCLSYRSAHRRSAVA
jgi:hypothetical protein